MSKYAILGLVLALAVASCNKDDCSSGQDNTGTDSSDESTITNITLSGMGSWISVKSVLEEGVERLVSSVKLAAYDSAGDLEITGYFTSTSNMSLALSDKSEHTIYALVNMGDVQFPTSEEDIADLEYTISSYSDISSSGIPIVGKSEILEAGETECQITATRLMARIYFSLQSSDVQPKSISYVKLNNCNTHLLPFGSEGSKAEESSQIISGEEGLSEELSDWDGETLVFYVPENMQGDLLEGNEDQSLKTPEGLSAAGYSDLADLCTYLEVGIELDEGEENHGVSGMVCCQFYLGEDTCTNFDVVRNYSYTVQLSLSWEGTLLEDSWRVDRQDVSDSRSLSLQGISSLEFDDSSRYYNLGLPKISYGSEIILPSNIESAVYVDFSSDLGSGSDFTLEYYGSEWDLTDESKVLLEEYDISWSVTKAKAMYSQDKMRVVYLEYGEDSGDLIDIIGDWQCCILLNRSETSDIGESIELEVESFDGIWSASAELTLWLGVDAELTLQGSGTYLIAESVDVSVSDLPDLLENPTLSLTKPEEIMGLYPYDESDGTSCYIQMLSAGSDILMLEGTVDGQAFSQPIALILVEAPVLKFFKDEYTLTAGDTTNFSYAYYDADGSEVVGVNYVALTTTTEYEQAFDKTLYSSLLYPTLSVVRSNGRTASGISVSSTQPTIFGITSGTISVDSDATQTDGLTLLAEPPCSSVADAEANLVWSSD